MSLASPPGPIGWPLLGMLPEFRKNPPEFLRRTAAEYGDVSYFRLGLQRIYFLNRPDLIEEVLVTNQGNFRKNRMLQRARNLLGDGLLTAEGSVHLAQRRLAQPAFSQERLAAYADAMIACADRSRERWHDGETLDIGEQMVRLTMAIVGQTLLGKDVESDAPEVGRALTDVIGTFNVMMTPGSSVLRHLPLRPMRRARRAQRYLDKLIEQLIRERRDGDMDQPDLLSMLLKAESTEDGRMSDKQVRDHALTFLLAGHETTATALTWAWYLLSQNPEVERRMRREIDEVVGSRLPRVQDVTKLEYTGRVFAETLRLYPPAWAIGRMAINSMRLYNFVLPRKSICVMSPYVMHRHQRFWPDPERFDPDRFLPDAVQSRPRFSYFPFGGGIRGCIGERFATTEGVFLLATIAQRWRFRLSPGHPVEPQALMTLRPRYGMKMVVEKADQR